MDKNKLWHHYIYVNIIGYLHTNIQTLHNMNKQFDNMQEDYAGRKMAKHTIQIKKPTVQQPDFGYHHAYLDCEYSNMLCKKYGFTHVDVGINNESIIVTLVKSTNYDDKKAKKSIKILNSKQFIERAKKMPVHVFCIQSKNPFVDSYLKQLESYYYRMEMNDKDKLNWYYDQLSKNLSEEQIVSLYENLNEINKVELSNMII